MSKNRLKEVRDRLDEIWYCGYSLDGGDIRPEHKEEFNALLNEEHELLSEEYERLYGEKEMKIAENKLISLDSNTDQHELEEDYWSLVYRRNANGQKHCVHCGSKLRCVPYPKAPPRCPKCPPPGGR